MKKSIDEGSLLKEAIQLLVEAGELISIFRGGTSDSSTNEKFLHLQNKVERLLKEVNSKEGRNYVFDRYRVVETDNFGGDYPDESFSSPSLRRKDAAEKIAAILNEEWGGPDASRFYKVVKMPYTLQPGFEP